MLSNSIRNTINSKRGISSFSNSYSFLLDGVNEYLDIPNADLSGILQGNVQKSITFVFYNTGGSYPVLWSNGSTNRGLYFYMTATGAISFGYTDAGSTARQTYTDVGKVSVNTWNVATFNVDTTNGSEIMVNGVNIPLLVDGSAGNNVIANSDDFSIGKGGVAGLDYYMGYINQISVNKILTLSEHTDLYNSLKPKNPQSLFGVDNHLFFNPDNSGSTAQFSVLDSTNSITATSVNMEDADKTTTTPY